MDSSQTGVRRRGPGGQGGLPSRWGASLGHRLTGSRLPAMQQTDLRVVATDYRRFAVLYLETEANGTRNVWLQLLGVLRSGTPAPCWSPGTASPPGALSQGCSAHSSKF